jgi:hypothetical protein
MRGDKNKYPLTSILSPGGERKRVFKNRGSSTGKLKKD